MEALGVFISAALSGLLAMGVIHAINSFLFSNKEEEDNNNNNNNNNSKEE